MILSANGVLWPQVPARSPRARSAALVSPGPETLDDAMRTHILDALSATNWVLGGPHGAAARLGMKRTALASRMEKLGIVRQHGTMLQSPMVAGSAASRPQNSS